MNWVNLKQFKQWAWWVRDWRALWRVVVAGAWGLLASAAWGQNMLVSQAVLEDPSGRLTIEQAAQERYQPLNGLLVRGYSPHVYWLKLEVRNDPAGRPLQMRIRPTFLDDLRLYQAQPDGTWDERISGDAHPVTTEDRVGTSLGFRLAPSAARHTTYFLRLSTTSSVMMVVEVMPRVQAFQQESAAVVWKILYIGFMLWLSIWAVQDYMQHKAVVSLTFAAYQGFNLIYAFMILGFGAHFPMLGGDFGANRYTSLAALGSAFFGLWFHRAVFVWVGLLGWRLRVIDGLIATSALLITAFAWGWEREAMRGNSLLVVALGVLFAVLAWSPKRMQSSAQRMVGWIYSLQLVSLVFSMAPLLGWVNVSVRDLYGVLLHSVISAMLVFYMLASRSMEERAQSQSTHQAHALAQQQLQLERAYSQEQAQFIDMLTHELKTPVAVAMMDLDRLEARAQTDVARIRRALTNINGIVERARWSDMLAHHQVEPVWRLVSLSEQVFEAIESTLEPQRMQVNVVDPAEVKVDPQLLTIVLSNLLDNALKYSPPATQVQVRISHAMLDGQMGAEVAVSNTIGSAGLPDAQRLFTKYYRSAGAGAISGSGLGLYLVRQLAALLRGRVSWRGRSDEAVFVLWLPI